jgi:hypothetical protein
MIFPTNVWMTSNGYIARREDDPEYQKQVMDYQKL